MEAPENGQHRAEIEDLLKAGVHFGHLTSRWNPKMKPFIFMQRNGVHVLDLLQTQQLLDEAADAAARFARSGRKILFVGTKKQAREAVRRAAESCGMPYVVERWLGGTLTNFQTVKKSIERLNFLTKSRTEGKFEQLTKKEALTLTREIEKMEKALGGIKDMRNLPGALFVIDPKKEHIAVKEAGKLGIPVVALCDTNCDPDGIDYVIPGNDDAIKSIRLFTAAIADAAAEGVQAGRTDASPIIQGDDGRGVEVYRRTVAEDPNAAERDEDA